MGLWGDLEILESESTFQKEMGKGGVLACLPCLALWLGQHRVLYLSFRVSFTLVSVSFQIAFLGLDLVVWEDGKGQSLDPPLQMCPVSTGWTQLSMQEALGSIPTSHKIRAVLCPCNPST